VFRLVFKISKGTLELESDECTVIMRVKEQYFLID